MKHLVMTNTYGVSFAFSLSQITEIAYPKAKDVCKRADLVENGIKPSARLIQIKFTDGRETTLDASCWTMKFE